KPVKVALFAMSSCLEHPDACRCARMFGHDGVITRVLERASRARVNPLDFAFCDAYQSFEHDQRNYHAKVPRAEHVIANNVLVVQSEYVALKTRNLSTPNAERDADEVALPASSTPSV